MFWGAVVIEMGALGERERLLCERKLRGKHWFDEREHERERGFLFMR